MSQPLPAEQATSNIVVDIILSLCTCGIYNLIWNARQFRAVNAFLGEERFNFWQWLLLSIITCGIYHIYTEYLLGAAIVQIQQRTGRPVNASLPLVCVVVSFMGFPIAADAIQQAEINQLYR
jgi:multidrug transporter EmrE-like cation transporter